MMIAEKASRNVKDILVKNLLVDENGLDGTGFLIIYDEQSNLSKILKEAYVGVLPNAKKLDFYTQDPEELKQYIKTFKTGDTVILIQSSSFRMSNFRWRLELFNLGYKVIEHGHLGSNLDGEEEVYVNSLNYDGERYGELSEKLKLMLDGCEEVKLETVGGNFLVYSGSMEEVKKNVGDYRAMVNKGSAFPIGEVFTEPKDMFKVNGRFGMFAFANSKHKVVFLEEPAVVNVVDGIVEFEGRGKLHPDLEEVILLLESENVDGKIRMRELGLGLNTAFSKSQRVTDISAYERLCGVHISLGMKHDIYRKKADESLVQRYHIDIFPDIERLWIGGVLVFEGGKYVI